MPNLNQTVANALGVSNHQDVGEWLARLFTLPKAEQRPYPRWLTRVLQWVLGRIANALVLKRPATAADWTAAMLFVQLPKPNSHREQVGSPSWEWFLTPIIEFLAPLTVRWQRVWERINFTAQGQRLEAGVLWLNQSSPLPRVLLLGLLILCFWFGATTPLDAVGQAVFLFTLWSAAMFFRRIPGDAPTLVMVAMSLLATSRYAYWRISETLSLDTTIDWVLGLGLIAAEIYTWVVLILGYIQNAVPLRRRSCLLPADSAVWPTVDVMIPTYNEPLSVVKPSVLAALGLDWPKDKLNIYLLDDGRRTEFKEFCHQIGIHYITRKDNRHAKAGNINHALGMSCGEIITIFDCDHIPTRSFLKTAIGWFLKDPQCAMVQTPHHFFSPDPFERNLNTFRRIPNEGSLFYGLVQDGNDLWNATFFCGSCAAIRRKPLMKVGGIAIETVTEDAHTALKLHRQGYNTAYLNITQAAGLATESLSAHIGQRIRWARGMAQIFRVDNPLFGKGLTLFQRLCYSNAMLHFFHGLPRMVFLTAPLAFLYLNAHVISAAAGMLALYALPHLMQAELCNSRMQGNFRHSFWAQAYETVLAWYVILPTTMALINPKLGTFNVTAKGGLVEKKYFDWKISLPYLIVAALNVGGLIYGLIRLLVLKDPEVGTLVINLIWTFYNIVMLGTALYACAEAKQIRKAHRIPKQFPVSVAWPGQGPVSARVVDYSMLGIGLQLNKSKSLDTSAIGNLVTVTLGCGDEAADFSAVVASVHHGVLGLRFLELNLAQEQQLVHLTFGRADAWMDWHDIQEPDRPIHSLREVLRYGVQGYSHFMIGFIKLLRRRLLKQPSPLVVTPA